MSKRNATGKAKNYTQKKKAKNFVSHVSAQQGMPKELLRYVDVPIVSVTLGREATMDPIYLLNGTKRGPGANNRDGQNFTMHSLHIRGYITKTGQNTVAAGPDLAKIAVIYDSKPNGDFPAITDIFGSSNYLGAQNTDVNALQPINMAGRNRFVVLAEWCIPLPPIGVSGANPADEATGRWAVATGHSEGPFFERYIKMQNLPTITNPDGDSGGIADIETGALYLVHFASYNSDAIGAWKATFTSRLKFRE